jgi:hypothetical protein
MSTSGPLSIFYIAFHRHQQVTAGKIDVLLTYAA